MLVVSMRDVSEALSSMDNAVAVYVRRHGRVPMVKSKVERLEAHLLETRSYFALAQVNAYARELHARK